MGIEDEIKITPVPEKNDIEEALRDDPVLLWGGEETHAEPYESWELFPDEQEFLVRGDVVEGFALGGADAIEITTFEEINGGRTRWHGRVLDQIASNLRDEWGMERSGLLLGYVNENGEQEVVDMLLVNVGERGRTHPLPDAELLLEHPDEIERRQAMFEKRREELQDEHPDAEIQIFGWYHDHPPADLNMENDVPTAPNPGRNDLSVNNQIQSSYTHAFRPLMLIGQKNDDATISLSLWRSMNISGTKVIYQPGILVTEQKPWHRYWNLPVGGQDVIDADNVNSVELD